MTRSFSMSICGISSQSKGVNFDLSPSTEESTASTTPRLKKTPVSTTATSNMKNILGLLLFGMLFVALQVDAICVMKPAYSNLGGYCFVRGVGTCAGTVIRKGCYGQCSLCIPDASRCIRRQRCANHNGVCLKKADWATCDRELDSYFCYGADCACCRTKICTRQDSCKNQGGYCYRLKANVSRQHVCNGRVDPAGCGGVGCQCCIPTAGK